MYDQYNKRIEQFHFIYFSLDEMIQKKAVLI